MKYEKIINRSWIIPVRDIVLSNETGDWCQLQYPGHKHGCPNYNKKPGCPPNAFKLEDEINLNKPLYLVHSWFNVEIHAKHMKRKHPNWSERQCRNLLYWQPKSRAQLMERLAYAMRKLKVYKFIMVPEAMGLNVYATARNSGLILDKIKDLKICRHVALLGSA